MPNNETNIKIRGLSIWFKSYSEQMPTLAKSLFGLFYRNRDKAVNQTALSKVNLDFKSGDKVGIIGRNGAGKSTLLKAIAGIYPPSAGNIKVYGNIACLLDLGAGFDVERTAIENIFIGGAIMGISRKEMRKKVKDILQFAELESFVNKPVKLLSSGMKSRLAFSIATSIDPEILILDEVFAAGDMAFIEKAKKRMANLIKNCDILLFVSHANELIEAFCNKGIVLNGGEVAFQGSSKDACKYYNKEILKISN